MDMKTLGELVEDRVIESVDGLRAAEERDDHYDAVVDGNVEGRIESESAVYVDAPDGALDDGTKIEIKACLRVQSDGAKGRFYIREKQHRELLDRDGLYLLTVYDVGVETVSHIDPDGVELAGFVIASAETVERVRNPWYEADGRENYTQIAWSNFSFDGVEDQPDARAEA